MSAAGLRMDRVIPTPPARPFASAPRTSHDPLPTSTTLPAGDVPSRSTALAVAASTAAAVLGNAFIGREAMRWFREAAQAALAASPTSLRHPSA